MCFISVRRKVGVGLLPVGKCGSLVSWHLLTLTRGSSFLSGSLSVPYLTFSYLVMIYFGVISLWILDLRFGYSLGFVVFFTIGNLLLLFPQAFLLFWNHSYINYILWLPNIIIHLTKNLLSYFNLFFSCVSYCMVLWL